MRLEGLTDGQVVTLLVGVGTELLARHAAGEAHGPVHPAHVRVDPAGRPSLAVVPAPPGWTPHDDWVSLVRLGRYVGGSRRAAALSWARVGAGDGADLLRRLLEWQQAEPLPPVAAATRGPARGGRPAARPRSSGPGR